MCSNVFYETWGHIGSEFDALLGDFAGLAGKKQRDRGIVPTKWLLKWRTHISIALALHVGRSILDAIPDFDRHRRFVAHHHFNDGDLFDAGMPDSFADSIGDRFLDIVAQGFATFGVPCLMAHVVQDCRSMLR